VPIRIRVEATTLSAEAAAAFRTDAQVCFAIYRRLRRRYRLPACQITALLAEDFTGAVEQHLQGTFRVEEGGAFDATRVGGVVAAKNLDQTDDAARVVIVFDASLWTHADEPAIRASLIHLVAHEMAHPVIERARFVSGVMDGIPRPSLTAHQSLRTMIRIMAGEYRADGLADLVLGECVSVGSSTGQTQPATQWGLLGNDYTANAVRVVDEAYPRWPDLVQAYREWRIPIEEMWARLGASVDQTLTAILHAQAAADGAQTGINILELPALAKLPAARLYLSGPWSAILAELRQQPFLAPLADVPRLEQRAVEVGERALLGLFNRLGITPLEHPDGRWGMKVDAPST
jgi:hypothetical protein